MRATCGHAGLRIRVYADMWAMGIPWLCGSVGHAEMVAAGTCYRWGYVRHAGALTRKNVVDVVASRICWACGHAGEVVSVTVQVNSDMLRM